jgi:hypothetical protein
MTTRILYIKIIFIILFCSCGHSSDADKTQNLSNSDASTSQTNDSNIFSRVITIDNKAFSSRGFPIDSITWPTCFAKFDSLYIYFPTKKYQKSCLYVEYDSLRAVQARQPDFEICNLRHSCIIKMNPVFYKKYDTLTGVLRCWDSVRNNYTYYPFVRPLK